MVMREILSISLHIVARGNNGLIIHREIGDQAWMFAPGHLDSNPPWGALIICSGGKQIAPCFDHHIQEIMLAQNCHTLIEDIALAIPPKVTAIPGSPNMI